MFEILGLEFSCTFVYSLFFIKNFFITKPTKKEIKTIPNILPTTIKIINS